MDFTVWDVLVGTISWGTRLLFWPLGLVIKYREFFGVVLPYLLMGAITLFAATVALGILGIMLRGASSVARGVFRLLGAIGGGFRPLPEDNSHTDDELDAGQTQDHTDPYQFLGLRRNVTESELDARYRELLKANHPDKVARLDPEIQAFAAERSRRIIEAYQQLRMQPRV